jgi:hypothetical protein
MRPSTSIKLFIAGVLCILFAGFILRAALRLASAAMHSFFVLALVVGVMVWAAAGMRAKR